MRQQVDLFITLDTDAKLDGDLIAENIEAVINKIDPEKVDVVSIQAYEEADIVGNSPACETMKNILIRIAREPLWGDTDIDCEQEAKDAGEWEDGHYAPSSDTESSQLEYVVNLARTYLGMPKRSETT